MNLGRAKTIYVKELVDILRDHRTLAAMIVAPIVLYPLLMLGGIQAMSSQATDIADERITVGFEQEWHWEEVVRRLLIEEGEIIDAVRAEAVARGADDEELAAIPESLAAYVDPKGPVDLEEAVLQRSVQCGVIVEDAGDGSGSVTDQLLLTIVMQQEDVRSTMAAERLEDAFRRVGDHRREVTLRVLNIDPRIVEPIVLRFQRMVTAGSVLGLILPFILVLMTVTGAIYPAIDLTAGERERGTLESLMVCPVPVIDLIVGKFMAVTTLAIMAAALNIASVTATVYFGGLHDALSGGAAPGAPSFPFRAFPIVLFSLVPFAVLMSAVMIAVCACARTFKEAQNYIMPVIMLVLLPGGIAALPGSKLEGVMIVTPVANMVLLTRNLLSGVAIPGSTFAWVLLSTSFYAAVAVAVAAQVFGKESVLFADTLSMRALVSRRLIRPRRFPTLSGAGLHAAILFPIWFHVQNSIQMATGEDLYRALCWTAVLLPAFFLVLPLGLAWYWKLDIGATFSLAAPAPRCVVGAVLIGVSAWVPAHELFVLQDHFLPTPPALADANESLNAALTAMPAVLAFLVLAVAPAVCEEFFFRGFLLSGLRTSFGKWTAIIACAVTFGAFHFFIFRLPVTTALGVLLGWMCWRSRSIWPAIVMHALHNGCAVALVLWPYSLRRLGVEPDTPSAHLPPGMTLIAVGALLAGLILIRSDAAEKPPA